MLYVFLFIHIHHDNLRYLFTQLQQPQLDTHRRRILQTCDINRSNIRMT